MASTATCSLTWVKTYTGSGYSRGGYEIEESNNIVVKVVQLVVIIV